METQIKFDPFVGPEISHILHITESQQELWHSCLFGGEDANRAYNESLSLVLKGDLDIEAIEKALQILIQRHESLRSVFSPDGNYMCVFNEIDFKLDFHDFSSFQEKEKDDRTNDYLLQDALKSFDLVNGPLIRAGLLKLTNQEHNLTITAHHIICDGWSFGIILEELGIIYSAIVENVSHKLPEVVPYSHYAEEQLDFSEGESIKKVESYWLNLHSDEVPDLNMPTDFPRSSKRSYKGNRFDHLLDKELVTELKKIGAGVNCSLVVTLMTAFEILLCEITGQQRFSLGLPTAGQAAMGAKHLVGHCVNLLPLRSNVNVESSFIDQLQRRKSANFDAFEHQELTFGRLLKELNRERIPSRIPLVPVVLNIDMGLDEEVSFSGLTYKLISNCREYETFELYLNATGTDESLVLEWSYNSTLFEKTSIENMAKSFVALLYRLIAEPNTKLNNIITKKTTDYEIKGLNKTYPKSTLHQLLQERANKNPKALALQFGENRIDYGELQKRINQTAHYLRSKGVRPGQVVAISLDRSPDLIVSIFAVLQCGASYVPIDMGFPIARAELMINDSGASFFISTNLKGALSHKSKVIFIEDVLAFSEDLSSEPLGLEISSESAAYIIYTSGSTGKPKGVEVAHRNVINLVNSMAKEPGIKPEDKIFAVTTISFDATVMEIFLPLLYGASVVFVDEETRRDGHLLLQKAVKDKISIMWGTPTIYQILLDSGWKKPLPLKVLIGGEPVPLPLARELLKKCDELWNIYGPTETTVCAFLTRITEEDDPITIGKPVANVHAYLLDEYGNHVGQGEIGEIAIGGDGVSMGYLNRPELNAKSFVEDTFSEKTKSKMYLSGDLGRLLPNGQIQCLGRRDRQVKVRGHRIELGEIEHALKQLPGVNSVVLDAKDQLLKAYIVRTDNGKALNGELDFWKEKLRDELPEYMVPQEFIFLDKIPTTVNGKLNRKQLAKLVTTDLTEPIKNAPRTDAQKIVSGVWQECLDIDEIDIYQSFFDIGGHSLIAAKVMTELELKTGKRLPLASLFEHSTVEKLAELLEKNKGLITWDSLVPIRPKGNKPPVFMVHGAGLNVLNFNPFAKYMDADQPIYGLQAKGLNGDEEPLTSVEEIAAHYNAAIRTIQPKGPYALAGYSFGGVVAYEMGRQLMDEGQQLSMLGLFDTYAFPYYSYKSKFGKKVGHFKFFAGQKIHTLKHMFGSVEGFNFRIRKYINMARQMYLRVFSDTKEDHDPRQERAIEIMQANDRAIDQYHLTPAPLKINLFRAKQTDEYVHDVVYLGWGAFALKGIEIHDVPGDHTTMFSAPNDKFFSKVLQEVLDRNRAKDI